MKKRIIKYKENDQQKENMQQQWIKDQQYSNTDVDIYLFYVQMLYL